MTKERKSLEQRAACAVVFALALVVAVFFSPYALAAPAQLEDGTYDVPITLDGGSGRASVESPAKVVSESGKLTATVVWSSSSYDKMTVAGTDYVPVSLEEGSTFEIPVESATMPVKAETTAMSTPHTIDYTLTFDFDSAQRANDGAVSPLAIVGAVVVLLAIGIVLGILVSRRKRI